MKTKAQITGAIVLLIIGGALAALFAFAGIVAGLVAVNILFTVAASVTINTIQKENAAMKDGVVALVKAMDLNNFALTELLRLKGYFDRPAAEVVSEKEITEAPATESTGEGV